MCVFGVTAATATAAPCETGRPGARENPPAAPSSLVVIGLPLHATPTAAAAAAAAPP